MYSNCIYLIFNNIIIYLIYYKGSNMFKYGIQADLGNISYGSIDNIIM